MLKFPQTDVNVIDIKPNKFSRLLFSYTFVISDRFNSNRPSHPKAYR